MTSQTPISQFRVPLRVFLVVPFLLQIFIVVSLTGWLSLRNGQKAVNDTALQLQSEVTKRIHEKLRGYVAVPPMANQITANAIATGQLNLKNPNLLRRHFWKQIQTFPNISFHFFGNTQGEFFTARRLASGEVQVGMVDRTTNQRIVYFVTDKYGDRVKVAEVVPNTFDPRQRPWYQTAVAAGQPTWTKIYRHFVTKGLTISAVHPIYDRTGKLQGVISADFVFLQVNKYLQELKIGQSGQTYIMERSGELVSTSTDNPIFAIAGDKTERIYARNSTNKLIRESANQIIERFGSFSSIQRDQQLEVKIDGSKHFLQVTVLKDNMGIDWLIVVAVPEANFMAQIERNTEVTIILCMIALGIATILGMYTAREISRPILHLSQAAETMATQAQRKQGQTVPEEGATELRRLARSFNSMSQQLQEAFARLQYSAFHDALTNLPNREAFVECLRTAISQHEEQPDFLLAVLFLDLDRFKLVNDSLGHLVGDRLLVAVAQKLKSCLRTNDQANDVISRFGGDEFIILLANIPSKEFAIQVAEDIQQTLLHPFDIDGNEIFTSVSIGIVSSPNLGNQPEDLLRDADIALYQAKLEGKARYKVFDTAMHTTAIELMQLEMDLRRGLNHEEFFIYYQPIVSLSNCQIVGLEALLRWNHPTHGFLTPNRFLSVAEDTGAIVNLDLWVLKEACYQLQNWQLAFPDSSLKHVGVNLSPKVFLQPDWIQSIDRILAETTLERSCLRLELVESTLMDSTNKTYKLLEQLRDSGIHLDIDDFGTGYSSLSYLCRFPLDAIKIDRSFITNLEHENVEIVRAIIILARNLGMETVAEGVETIAQFQILKDLGCDKAQGYLFSHPMSVGAVSELLSQEINVITPKTGKI